MSEKKKKVKIVDLIKQTIANKYNTSPIIASCNGQYVAIDKDHIQLFKYNKESQDVDSLGTYYFKDFDTVTIDHFAIKSVIRFKGVQKNLEITPTEETDEIEKLLRSDTNLSIETLNRKWYNKILGFRSKKKSKMIIASTIYLLIIVTTINILVDKKENKNQPTKASESTTDKDFKILVEETDKQKEELEKKKKQDQESQSDSYYKKSKNDKGETIYTSPYGQTYTAEELEKISEFEKNHPSGEQRRAQREQIQRRHCENIAHQNKAKYPNLSEGTLKDIELCKRGGYIDDELNPIKKDNEKAGS
ncbi:hypothetical protein ACO11K_002457 [Bacillus cytotoxicus]